MASQESRAGVWVFNGANAQFPAGVFSTRESAERWIAEHKLSGTLTLYPLDVGAFDWAVENGLFRPKHPQHTSPSFVQAFSSRMAHYHYENGLPADRGQDD